MKMKFVLLVVGVAGAVALVAWRESRFARQAQQTLTTLTAANTKVAMARREAEARLTAAEKERADLQATLDTLPKPSPTKTTAPAKKPNPDAATAMMEWAKAEEERQKDPQVQLRQLAAARTKLTTRYGALYWKLKLTPEQVEQFETIAARKAEQYDDLLAALIAQGVSMGGADFTRLYVPLHEKIDDAYHAGAKELLGEMGYQQFNDYERQLSARTHVQAVAGAAVLAGTPFSPQQAEQLVGILANASGNYRQGRDVLSLDIEWDQVDERAREILSSEQLTAFQTLEPSTDNTGRLWMQFNRAMDEARRADRKQAGAAKPAGKG